MQVPELIDRAWQDYGDERAIVDCGDAAAYVSTNRVYQLLLEDETYVFAKVSSYGSYFLFREDHDRIHRWRGMLKGTRWENFLADALTRDGRLHTYYDDNVWVIFYQALEVKSRMPRILEENQITNLAREMAEFHRACLECMPDIPLTSKSIKSDMINLLDLLSEGNSRGRFPLTGEELDSLKSETHDFLTKLDELEYDYRPKIPLLIDWNLGNFSVEFEGEDFKLFSRWDYDWFRIEPRVLDFYFCSRVCSSVGDKTEFSYFPGTLMEPRFRLFLKAYVDVMPLEKEDILLMRESFRFFILNYVIREGEHFFVPKICARLQKEAVNTYLPELGRLDFSELYSFAKS